MVVLRPLSIVRRDAGRLGEWGDEVSGAGGDRVVESHVSRTVKRGAPDKTLRRSLEHDFGMDTRPKKLA